MKKIHNRTGFTLVEILVAITIFSIVMVSVISIYIYSAQVTYKSELNRHLHENVKSVVSYISEDVMKHGIKGVGSSCDFIYPAGKKYKSGNSLCTGTGTKKVEYKWFKKDLTTATLTDCDELKPEEQCYVYMNDGGKDYPLTNNMISVKNLEFLATGKENDEVKKVTVLMTIIPSLKLGVPPKMIKNTEMKVQFTITDRETNHD